MSTSEERVKQFNSTRDPVYVAIKYGLMKDDPFVFFRGSCHLFYEDLHKSGITVESPESWICGDLHLENFGSYKGDNRLVYFDLTDFDEGILAPAAWELLRIVTSIFIALDKSGSKLKEITPLAKLFLQTYSEILNRGKARYIEQQTAIGITRLFLEKVAGRTQKELIDKRTTRRDGKLNLKIDNSKLFAVDGDFKKELISHLNGWIQDNKSLPHDYKAVDAGFRIGGTGSIGIKRYLFLLKEEDNEKHLLIDMKQAMPSSLKPYSGTDQPGWPTEAERVIAIQQRMQNISPALLSTTVFNNNSFVLKEMQPTEDKIEVKLFRDNNEDTISTIQDLALLTASAHLRSSGRQGSANADALIEFGGKIDWQAGIIDYAIAYAEQVKKDYQAYVKAYEAGFFSTHLQ